MFPLTGNGSLDKDLAEERQRDILEDVQADKIAEGDPVALSPDEYQPVTDSEDDLVSAHKSNEHVHGGNIPSEDEGTETRNPNPDAGT